MGIKLIEQYQAYQLFFLLMRVDSEWSNNPLIIYRSNLILLYRNMQTTATQSSFWNFLSVMKYISYPIAWAGQIIL